VVQNEHVTAMKQGDQWFPATSEFLAQPIDIPALCRKRRSDANNHLELGNFLLTKQ
jgi:hypothetical protein